MAAGENINDEPDELFEVYNRVEEIKKYVSANLQSDLRAETIAGQFNLSVSSLYQLFKKYNDQTYHRYVEDSRLNIARDLIVKEGLRIKEAMFACGYHNRTAFNAAFKKKFKHRPGDFRK